ncbi:hypothetical protein [Flavobacterium reichenbachii]|uniref:DUF4259 domain-containing protein n=1 Tax=Flavobacterium reichenbachii TaxID=362418 RepID=A0A085ZMF8_9FLAO|nr:hypothetical protein [Flavobacterium reichenbachii]KFF05622.1 hypothetical protein IW19_08875 [Flavobacterium reichenbachii]OXB17954.1 hypothetical protein B0A68_03185 [Flavobacterium reichenbachii]
MGTWGTGIKSNDTSSDIYDDFFKLYNEGKSVKEISDQLVTENKELIENKSDSNNFWFALALCQWECKQLENPLLEKIKKIIESKSDLLIWKELEATDVDIKQREIDLNKFLTKLQTEKKTAKKIVITKYYNSIFKKGDCFIFKMIDGNYGGALVLTDEQNTEIGANFIALTDISKIEKPTINDFKEAEVYIKREKDVNHLLAKFGKIKIEVNDISQIGMVTAVDFKREKIEFETIGNLKLYREYKIGNSFRGIPWNQLLQIVPNKENDEKLYGKPKTKIKLSKWTKWHWL